MVSVANATLLAEQNEEPLENGNEQSLDDDDDDDNLDDMGISTTKTNFEDALNNVNAKLLGIQPSPPPVVSETQVNNNGINCTINTSTSIPKKLRPPHCTKCTHAKTGHGRSSMLKNSKCPMCPSQICSDTGVDIPCTCKWHLSYQSEP